MSAVSDRVKSLENLLSDREDRLNKKITRTIIIYVILVCFTGAYTIFMVYYLKRQTSPDVLSEVAVNLTSQYAAKGRDYAVNRIGDNSEELAQAVVTQTIESIPKAEIPILNAVDIFIDYVEQHMKNELIPAFTRVLEKHADELRARYQDLQDEEKMQGLALVFVDILELEMDRYINEALISEVFELKKKLLEFARADATLTKKQLAQREVLINWVYLTENQDVGDSFFFNFIEKVKDGFNSIMEVEDQEEYPIGEALPQIREPEGIGFSAAAEER